MQKQSKNFAFCATNFSSNAQNTCKAIACIFACTFIHIYILLKQETKVKKVRGVKLLGKRDYGKQE